jgi:hypothetical protein
MENKMNKEIILRDRSSAVPAEMKEKYKLFWTNDVPLLPHKNGVACFVEIEPQETIIERAKEKIFKYVESYTPVA